MRKAILFPFKINHNNNLNYVAAIELAKEKELPLICFTALPTDGNETDLDKVYLHLLQLNGFWQTHVNNWQSNQIPIIKRVVKKGSFNNQLLQFIANTTIQLILFQTSNTDVEEMYNL